MLASFSEFKFFQSFRVPIEEADDMRFLVEFEDSSVGKWHYIDDAKILDICINGLGFSTAQKLNLGQELRISIHFKKFQLDLVGKVVRAFSGNYSENVTVYGVELEEDETEEIKKFMEQYIFSFNPDRLRDCMIQMVLADRYSSTAEGFEMFSLLLSLFKDMTNFGEKEDFIQVMLEEVVRVMNAKRASIYLINATNNQLETLAHVGGSKRTFDYRQGVAGSVFTTGISLNLDAINDNSRFVELGESKEEKIVSIICTPVYNREDKIIGVLEVINKKTEERFDSDDEKSMKVIALVFSSIFHNYNPTSEVSTIRRFSPAYDRKLIVIGRSKYTLDLRASIVKVKDLDCPLFIEGENGVGKTLYAQVAHSEGKRGLNKFLLVHCGGLTEEDLTHKILGADGDFSPLKECHKGTVFLHEISHMPLATQKALMEFIKTRLSPFVSNGLDIRIIGSSVHKISKLVQKGKFNAELGEYLSKSKVYIQPLRKRLDDLKDLILHFIKLECRKQGLLLKSFSPSVMTSFLEYDWPGNVKELKSCVEKAILYNPKVHVINNIDNMATPLFEYSSSGPSLEGVDELSSIGQLAGVQLKDRLALIERQMILNEIKRNNGNKSKAAREMGISREALRKKLMISQEILDKMEKGTSDSPSQVDDLDLDLDSDSDQAA